MFSLPFNTPGIPSLGGPWGVPPVPRIGQVQGATGAYMKESEETSQHENHTNTAFFLTPAPENTHWERGTLLMNDTLSEFSKPDSDEGASTQNSVPARLMSLDSVNQFLKHQRGEKLDATGVLVGDSTAAQGILRRFVFTGFLVGHNEQGRLVEGISDPTKIPLLNGSMHDVGLAVQGRVLKARDLWAYDAFAQTIRSPNHPLSKSSLAASVLTAEERRMTHHLHLALVYVGVSKCGTDDMAGVPDKCWQFVPVVSTAKQLNPILVQSYNSNDPKGCWAGGSVHIGSIIHPSTQALTVGVSNETRRAAGVFVHGKQGVSSYIEAATIQPRGDHPMIDLQIC